MSFSRKYVHKHTNKNNQRKEYGSFLTQHSHNKHSHKRQKRASVFTSLVTKKKGSVTIEAAMAVPVFFFAVICLVYLLEIMAIQTSIKAASYSTCKEMTKNVVAIPLLMPQKVKADVVNAIGKDRLERSIIAGGSDGINCYKSWVDPKTATVTIVTQYKVLLPIPQFGIPPLSFTETVKMKGWTGYVKNTMGEEGNRMVYITENGTVYHKDYHCTHLDLSIRMVTGNQVPDLRNESQGKYKPCEKCTHGGSTVGVVYITNTGDRYHGTLSCSGLKRRIYTVLLSEVKGKGACSRCGT